MAQPFMICQPSGSDQTDEWMRLGVEAQLAGKLPDAQRYYQQSLRLNPRNAIATQNLAIVFAQSNLLNEALLTIERASMMDGVHGVIQMNWALMAMEAEHIDIALAAARRGVEIAPGINTRLALAMALTTAGKPNESIPLYEEILKEDPKHPAGGPNSCFIQTLTNATPAELRAARNRWYEANHYTGEKKPHKNEKTERVLRIGYVSGDFKRHSAEMIFSTVVLNHTKDFELYLYSNLAVDPKADSVTKQFMDKAGDRWRDITGIDDEKAEALIRQDKIDILVDLAGHTNGGRLSLFTRKPAPVQVTAWGFAHGTGCPEIDYFFADPVAVPFEEREFYAEKIYDLPCIVTYNPPTEYNISGKSALPYHRNDYITFGSYARYEKLSDECLDTFAKILKRVPDSRLELKDHGFRRPYSIKRVQEHMVDIAPERLLFSISTSHPEHLQTYQQADLILDPFPHTGGVVGMEQLFMGVPIVTLYGKQASGRSTSSVLTQMGHKDWIAKTPEEYIEKAVAMSSDIPMLTKIRKTLRDELLQSPVVKGYVGVVEDAYKRIWREWIAK